MQGFLSVVTRSIDKSEITLHSTVDQQKKKHLITHHKLDDIRRLKVMLALISPRPKSSTVQ